MRTIAAVHGSTPHVAAAAPASAPTPNDPTILPGHPEWPQICAPPELRHNVIKLGARLRVARAAGPHEFHKFGVASEGPGWQLVERGHHQRVGRCRLNHRDDLGCRRAAGGRQVGRMHEAGSEGARHVCAGQGSGCAGCLCYLQASTLPSSSGRSSSGRIHQTLL